MHISLITSLYRSEAHLPTYGEHVKRFMAAVQRATLDVEILAIANDPTPTERSLLADMPVRVIETERETLYASWNRGLAMIQSDVFGMWNVDDIRDSDALIEAYKRIQQGDTLVDAPMHVRTRVTKSTPTGPVVTFREHIRASYIHEIGLFTRKHCMNPFALMHRRLLDEVGPFDPNFRVVGDLDWSGRAQKIATIGVLSQPGGIFNLHGDNLSSTGSTRQMIEENIVFLRRQQWDEIQPTPEPSAMREAWETWGNPSGIALPAPIEAMLWGENARQTWAAWQSAHQRRQQRLVWSRRARAMTDRLGLTYFLQRLRRSNML